MIPLIRSVPDAEDGADPALIQGSSRYELIEPFADVVRGSGEDMWELSATIMTFMVRYGYDARTRTCAHNFCALMGVTREGEMTLCPVSYTL